MNIFTWKKIQFEPDSDIHAKVNFLQHNAEFFLPVQPCFLPTNRFLKLSISKLPKSFQLVKLVGN